MGNCSGLCHKNIQTSAHSDLFVPQFDINYVGGAKKTILKLHSYKNVNNLDINIQRRISKMTTEQIIKAKTIRGKLSQTIEINSSKQISNEIQEKKQKYSLDESVVDVEKTIMPNNNVLNEKYSLILPNNNDSKNNIKSNHLEIKKKDTYSKFRTLQKKDSSKMEKIDTVQDFNIKYEIKEQELSREEEITLAKIFLHHYFFHRIDKEILSFLFKEIKVFQIEENTTIFYEGDEGSCLFILKSGEVKLTSEKGNKILIIKDGTIFGELALLKERIIRTYTATTLTNVSFYSIDEITFSYFKDKFLINKETEFELFQHLDNNTKLNLNLLTINMNVRKGQVINESNCLFEIINGELSIFDIKNKEIDKYQTGEICGIKNCFVEFQNDNNIYYNLIRNQNQYKIIAKEDTIFNIFYVNALIETFGIEFKYKILFSFFKQTLLKDYFFSHIIPKECINSVYSQFTIEEHKRGTYLSKDNIIIIISGIAIKHVSKTKSLTLKNRDIIGKVLLLEEKIDNIIVNTNHLFTFECSYNNFKESIFINNLSFKKWVGRLRDIFLFQNITEYCLYEIAKYLELNIYQKNDIIVKIGEINEKIYFINSGSAKMIIDGKTFKEYHKGNSFGEVLVLDEKQSKIEIKCSEKNSKFYEMDKTYFYLLMANPHLNKKIKKKLCLENSEILPKDLYHIQSIYKGKNSNIYLVHNKLSIYILKAVYIGGFNFSNQNNIIPRIINEKKASKRLDNKFIVKYVKTLKNNSWCFFIEEYISGISLRDYIEIIDKSNDLTTIKFFSGILFLILDSLKSFGIIHRDIKPENIIIDEKGYIKLIDFSCSKRIKNNYTKTIIGTPMFIAPEILNGENYSYSCDYWSVGIVLYYLFYEEYPFGNNTKEPDSLYKEILNKNIKIPFSKIDNGIFSNFLQKLLVKDTNLRYCSLNKISSDEFFKDINFEELKMKKIRAPFIPKVVKCNKRKMLTNLKNPFVEFIQKEKIGENEYFGNNQDNFSIDKDIVIENIDENIYNKEKKNWFEDF